MLYRAANVRGCARGQAVTDVNEISTRNNQQTISPDLRFAHLVQMWRIHSRIVEVVAVQDCFDGRDIVRRGSGSIEQEDGSNAARC